MTMISLVIAYAALTLGFWLHALYDVRVRRRSRRRERLLGVEERVLIAIVALLVSAAWPLLLPIKMGGRARLALERRGRVLRCQLAHWRRPRVVAGISR